MVHILNHSVFVFEEITEERKKSKTIYTYTYIHIFGDGENGKNNKQKTSPFIHTIGEWKAADLA